MQGTFGYSSDLFAEDMLWGHTLRSPHPHARITAIDIGPALRIGGVYAVLTADDVPGDATYGLETPDQPVLARDVVRYMGEPVAIVAADHPETARRAAQAIRVSYDPLVPLVDPMIAAEAHPIHPDGNVFRHLVIRHGDPTATGPVSVEGTYEIGMQDQAPLGTEAGLAVPNHDGSIDLFVSTQALHNDLEQVSSCVGLPEEMVHITLAGVGGAFGAREDVSLQIHLALLALHTGRPVKMVYDREESFFGHVHRHPARLWYRHTADRDGRLIKVEARLWFDGGAYASTSAAVLANASCFSAGPYRIPNALIDGWAVRTNNPPCGAMRGFGAVQTCFGHEAQMDKLAAALGMDPDRAAPAQRHGARRSARHRPGRHRRGAGGRGDPHLHRRADPGPRPPGRPDRVAGGRRAHRRVGRRPARRRLRGRDSRTSGSPRASTTTPPRGCAWPTASPPSPARAPRSARAS